MYVPVYRKLGTYNYEYINLEKNNPQILQFEELKECAMFITACSTRLPEYEFYIEFRSNSADYSKKHSAFEVHEIFLNSYKGVQSGH